MLTIGTEEVREAIRSWMEAHGVPNAIVDDFQVESRSTNIGFQKMDEMRVTVQYEADALAPHEGRALVVGEPVKKPR